MIQGMPIIPCGGPYEAVVWETDAGSLRFVTFTKDPSDDWPAGWESRAWCPERGMTECWT